MFASARKSQAIRYFAYAKAPGSLEHFWHFTLGFMLPFLKQIGECTDIARSRGIVVPSFGPVMNKLTESIVARLEIPATFDESLIIRTEAEQRIAAWSRHAALRLLKLDQPPCSAAVRRKNDVFLPRLDHDLKFGGLDASQFRRDVSSVREMLISHAHKSCCCDSDIEPGSILLLKRSAQPEFYSAQGDAEIKGYGSGRRELHGLTDVAQSLSAAGATCKIYEPGKHDVFCQAKHFASARAIIGVRGAELTNMIWLKKTALVLMIRSDFISEGNRFKATPPQRRLAKALKIDGYYEIEVPNVISPTLSLSDLAPILNGQADRHGPSLRPSASIEVQS